MEQITVGAKIGKYLKYQREKRQLSITEFAKRAEITPSFLLRLEKGSYHDIGFDAVEKLAKGLQMDLGDLLDKCKITSGVGKLPSVEFYLKEKFQFPQDGIQEVRSFIEYIKMKYKKQIKLLKTGHEDYWDKSNQKI